MSIFQLCMFSYCIFYPYRTVRSSEHCPVLYVLILHLLPIQNCEKQWALSSCPHIASFTHIEMWEAVSIVQFCMSIASFTQYRTVRSSEHCPVLYILVCGMIKQNQSEVSQIQFTVFFLTVCIISTAIFCRKPH